MNNCKEFWLLPSLLPSHWFGLPKERCYWQCPSLRIGVALSECVYDDVQVRNHGGDVMVSLIEGTDDVATQFVAVEKGGGGDALVDDSYLLVSLNGQKDVKIQDAVLLLKSQKVEALELDVLHSVLRSSNGS